MEYSFILFAVIAGFAANLSTTEQKTRLCHMYAWVLLFAGFIGHCTTMWIDGRDAIYPASDSITRLLDFSQYIVPAALNIFALLKFIDATNKAYRLVSIPLIFTVLCNIGIPLEFRFFGTTQIWSMIYLIPALCAIEVTLLMVGSDVIRDKFGHIGHYGSAVRDTNTRTVGDRRVHRRDPHSH